MKHLSSDNSVKCLKYIKNLLKPSNGIKKNDTIQAVNRKKLAKMFSITSNDIKKFSQIESVTFDIRDSGKVFFRIMTSLANCIIYELNNGDLAKITITDPVHDQIRYVVLPFALDDLNFLEIISKLKPLENFTFALNFDLKKQLFNMSLRAGDITKDLSLCSKQSFSTTSLNMDQSLSFNDESEQNDNEYEAIIAGLQGKNKILEDECDNLKNEYKTIITNLHQQLKEENANYKTIFNTNEQKMVNLIEERQYLLTDNKVLKQENATLEQEKKKLEDENGILKNKNDNYKYYLKKLRYGVAMRGKFSPTNNKGGYQEIEIRNWTGIIRYGGFYLEGPSFFPERNYQHDNLKVHSIELT